MRYDALIVGGGPAGAALAIRLATRRLRVMVLDRAEFPRDKPCGEGLLPGGMAALEALGLARRATAHGAPALDAIEFVAGRRRARGAFPRPGAGLDRRRFDHALATAARDAGAAWVRGVAAGLVRDERGRVTGVALERGEALEASVVIGADGARSWTRRALGLTAPRTGAARYGLCARVEVAPARVGNHVEVHLVPGTGELYVTPTGARQLSLSLLAPRERIATLRGRIEPAVREACARAPSLGQRLAPAVPLGRTAATGPLGPRALRPFAAGALLVGDAAGAVDPVGGDGMTLALCASEPCAEAVMALLAGTPGSAVERAYETALARISRRRRTFVAGMLALAQRPTLASALIAGLSRAPSATAMLCALHEGL